MEELLKYQAPEEKYTNEEFLVIFKERSLKLYNEYENLTVEEARSQFSKLFDDCPIGLLINPFGLETILKNHFPNFHDSSNSRVFKINVENIPENEVESYMDKIVKKFKNHD